MAYDGHRVFRATEQPSVPFDSTKGASVLVVNRPPEHGPVFVWLGRGDGRPDGTESKPLETEWICHDTTECLVQMLVEDAFEDPTEEEKTGITI